MVAAATPMCPPHVDRPPKKPVVRYHDFMCRATGWDRERHVVAEVDACLRLGSRLGVLRGPPLQDMAFRAV